MRDFVAIIHKDPGSDFGVLFPDFPGCITAGATVEEAKALAQEALEGHLEVSLAHGDPMPEPMGLEAALAHELAADAVAYFIVKA